jgi:hypothetical protein
MQLTEALKQARTGNGKQLTVDETRYLAKIALRASSTPRADLFDVVEEIFQAGYLSGQEAPIVEPVDETYDLLTESDLAAVGESACYGELG